MLQIKEDDKFFSRLLSKESSTANPSFRVYYGGVSVGVPFMWEAKPGTPKNTKHSIISDHETLPPLTPPPSYTNKSAQAQAQAQPNKKPNKILNGLFPRMMHRRQISSSSSSTLSSWSSGSDSTTSSSRMSRSRSLSSPGSLFDFVVNDQELLEEELDEEVSSPKSILCFGLGGSRKIRSTASVVHHNNKV